MPITYKTRTTEVEQRVAKKIREIREAKELSYHALAEQMKAVGCDIHHSAIQKTEKAGRRTTVDELAGLCPRAEHEHYRTTRRRSTDRNR